MPRFTLPKASSNLSIEQSSSAVHYYASLLKSLANAKALEDGRQLHQHLSRIGCAQDTYLGNSLVRMYGKCGCLEDAHRVFDSLPRKSAFSWNIMIAAYAQNGHMQEAESLFKQLKNPDAVAWTSMFVGYSRSGDVQKARQVFDSMEFRDEVAYNAMIAAYAQNGHPKGAVQVFWIMNLEGVKPKSSTFVAVFEAFGEGFRSPATAASLHQIFACSEVSSDVIANTAVMNMYTRCSRLDAAKEVFDQMAEKNVVSWTSMISAYAQNGLRNDSKALFDQMPERNIVSWNVMLGMYDDLERTKEVFERMPCRDVLSWNAAMTTYAQKGHVLEARKFFDNIPDKNVVSWNAMIAAYAQDKQGREALELFREMDLGGVQGNEISFTSCIDACSSLAVLQQGRIIHASVSETKFYAYPSVQNALLDMYGKCGSLQDASDLFARIKRPDFVLWSSMVTALSQNGEPHKALELFKVMNLEGVDASEVTFISVLSACNHAGLFWEGVRYFKDLQNDFKVTPIRQHYLCMVDLLGRAGYLGKAEELARSMPFDADSMTWMTVLGARRLQGDVKRAARLTNQAISENPEDSAAYMLMSNLQAAVGNLTETRRIKTLMLQNRAKIRAGLSWIEVKNKVHEFTAGGIFHPQKNAIHRELKIILNKLKAIGYAPDTSEVAQNVKQHQKENLLAYHSEKVAVVFGLISTPTGITLRVVKNLRICLDCHSAMTLVSKISGREIIVKDAVRFHRFKDGFCSCRDCW